MPRIKLVRIHSNKYGSHYSSYAKKVATDITDWEDVTHEELKFLKSPSGKGALKNQKDGFEDYIIVEKLEKSSINNKLQSLKELMQKAKEAEQKRKDALKQKSILEEQKRQEKKQAEENKKIEEAKRLLAKNGMKVLE